MERFVKAVELARQDVAPEQDEKPLKPLESAVVEPLRPRDAAVNRPQPAGTVQYAQTRRADVSLATLHAHHISTGQERTPFAEAFKRIRTQVIQRLRESGRNTLGIASPRVGEGKTTVALNLAVHTAVEPDWTVLVVEADIRHAGVGKALGLQNLPGLTDYLLRDVPLEELLVDPGFGRCVLLPAGAPIPGSSEALGSARMQDLVNELKRRYPDRLVIFDLPPVLDAADGIAVLPWVEALLLVAEEAHTLADDLVRSAQLVGSERLIGTVLNKSRMAVSAPGERPGLLRRLLTGA
jgi:Mrp family chromosome partitioning ATPase